MKKVCKTCCIEKSCEEFGKNKRTADWLTVHCIECNRDIYGKRHARWKKNNPLRAKQVIKRACDRYRAKPESKIKIKKQKEEKREQVKLRNEKLKDPTYASENPHELKKKLHESLLDRKRSKKWRENNTEKREQVLSEWEERNPNYRSEYYHRVKDRDSIKLKARGKLGYSVRNKVIAKPDKCEVCGKEGKLDGHHHDYSKPLDVKWVCKSCHVNIHSLDN